MKSFDVVAAALVIVGALNWGLVGALNFDFVAILFGEGAIISRIVYVLVGIAGIFQIVEWRAIQRRWGHQPPRPAPSM